MTSREEKNKKYVDEIKKEKAIKITKKIFKIFGIFTIIITSFYLYAYFYEPNKLIVHEYLINDIKIPDEYNGKKILHFSDLLYGKVIDENKLSIISEEIKLINPDMVVFTGNIVSKDYEISEDEIKLLNNFFSNIPYRIGKYAITGDTDTRNFKLIMENTDFNILDNELIDIYNGINKINMIGIGYDETKDIKKDNADYTITIINNYDEYEKYNLTSDLIFAGHNLGGEIRLFNLPLLGHNKYSNSYYEENNSKIYISNGIGSPHHLRFLNMPSMNVYRLYNK